VDGVGGSDGGTLFACVCGDGDGGGGCDGVGRAGARVGVPGWSWGGGLRGEDIGNGDGWAPGVPCGANCGGGIPGCGAIQGGGYM